MNTNHRSQAEQTVRQRASRIGCVSESMIQHCIGVVASRLEADQLRSQPSVDLMIKRGYKFDGTFIWDIGKHLPAAHGGIFFVLFSLDYQEGETNEDLWRRAVDTFADKLRVAPIA